MKTSIMVLSLAAVALAGLGASVWAQGACSGHRSNACAMACKDQSPAAQPASTPSSRPAQAGKPANAVCPIMGGTVDPDKTSAELTRQFRGQTVGFCCGGCPAPWDKLTDEQKAAKLAPSAPKADPNAPHAGHAR
jgi:hypothetical protein